MIDAVRQMLTCHWSARRISRYLDSDPAAPLSPGEVSRLENHLANCEKCTEVLGEHRALTRALARWSSRSEIDPAAVQRLRGFVDDLIRNPPK